MSNSMKLMLVRSPGSITAGEGPVPEPGPGEVRLRVHACGVCHSDVFTVLNLFPGIVFPRAPGHEIAGVVDALGAGVTNVAAGARVGVGWHGGHDGTCRSCERGDFITCTNLKVPGIAYDGGYAPYVVAPANVLAPIPDELSFEEAAPLLCAGVTTYNALRNARARAGDVVAVYGIGGLGHLGVQYARAMGFETIAIARGRDKEPLARRLGAHDYIDSESEDVAARLSARGGAKVILATITSGAAMSAAVGGLAVDGVLLVVGATTDPIAVPSIALLGKRLSIAGWPSGTGADSADTLRFSVLTGVRAMIETLPFARAQDAFDKMMSGAARFRMVLTDNA
jgi:D-arabinose 1-dehydrogenase-like Zn-dependent alcohol dehydrogenase